MASGDSNQNINQQLTTNNMKITFHSFKTSNGNKVFSNNTAVLKQYIISEDGLNTALDIAYHQYDSVYDLLSHKVMYISIPMDVENNECYSTEKVFVVRTNNGIRVWSDEFGFMDIENNDIIFTTADEANKLTALHIEYEGLIISKKIEEERIQQLKKEIQEASDAIEKLEKISDAINMK